MDLKGWLEKHGLGAYADAFEENEVTLSYLHQLLGDDLKTLGLKGFKEKNAFRKALKSLPTPSETIDFVAPPNLDVRSWLASLSYDDYADAFEEAEVTSEDLGQLNNESLFELGIESLKDRMVLLQAIANQDVMLSASVAAFPAGLDPAEMPTYLVHPWVSLCAEGHPRVKLHWLIDTVELIVRWGVAVAIAEVLEDNEGQLPDKVVNEIRDHIERPTLGRWLSILRTLTAYKPKSPLLVPKVFELYEKLEPHFQTEQHGGTLETSLLMLRNQVAHGGGMRTSRASALVDLHMPNLQDLLRGVVEATAQVEIVAFSGPSVVKLLGLKPQKIKTPSSLKGEEEGTWLVGADRALAILPLASYEPVRRVDADGLLIDQPGGEAAQIYARAGRDRLSYTPLGRDEAHSETLAIEDFRALFKLDAPRGTKDAIAAIGNQNFAWDDFLHEAHVTAEDLVGRTDELKVIKKWLKSRKPRESSSTNVGWVSAGPGTGKSMIMARLAADYGGSKHRGFFYHRFRGGDARNNRRSFLQLLRAALWAWEPLQKLTEAPTAETAQGEALVQDIEARLAAVLKLEASHPKAPPPSFWVFIDGLDEVVSLDPHMPDLLMQLSSLGTVFLLAGRPEHGLDQIFSGGKAESIFPQGLPPMSAGDIRSMLIEGLGNVRYALLKRDEDDDSDDGVKNAFIDRVVDRAKGLPLYVHLLLEDLRSGSLTVNDDDKLPDGLTAYYDALMDRIGLSTVKRDLPLLVCILALAQEPLDQDALKLLLADYFEDADHFKDRVETALRVGQALLRKVPTRDGAEGYTLYHQSFREYVAGKPADAETPAAPPAKALAGTVDEVGRKFSRLSDSWDKLPAGSLRDHLFRWGTLYTLRAHGDSGRNKVKDRLCDFGYVHARIEALDPAEVVDLVDEYGDLIAQLDDADRALVRNWEGFLRLRTHLITRGTKAWAAGKILLQLAVEHADESPVTKAAEAWLAQGKADWLYLRRARRPAKMGSNACLHILEGHHKQIEGATVLDDGRGLSWSLDGTLRVWNLQTGVCAAVMKGHRARVKGGMQLDAEHALSWSEDGTLRIWSLEDGAEQTRLDEHASVVEGARLLDDGRIVSWSRDKTIRVWERDKCKSTLKGHRRFAKGLKILKTQKLLTWDRTLRLWNPEEEEPEITLKGHEEDVRGVFEVDADRVLSWGLDKTVCLWNLNQEDPLLTLEGHTDEVFGARMLPDERILSWGKDGTLRTWTKDGKPQWTLDAHKDAVWGARILKDGRVLSWSDDGSLKVWKDDEVQLSLVGHRGPVRSVRMLDGDRLLTYAREEDLLLWDLNTGKKVARLDGHSESVWGVQTLDDNRVLSWSRDRTLRVWSTDVKTDVQDEERADQHTNRIQGTRWYGEEGLLSWSLDKTLKLWSTGTGRAELTLEGHEDRVDGGRTLSDGRVLSWSNDNTVRLWSEEGKELAKMEGHTKLVQGARQLKSERIISWSSDATLRLWASDGSLVKEMEGHTKLVQGVLELEDGRILSWSSDATLRLWSADGEEEKVLKGHKKIVQGAKILSDGRLLSWSSDSTLRIWSADGEEEKVLEGHNPKKAVKGALELQDGKVVSWSLDNTLKLWNLKNGRCLNTFQGHTQEITHAAEVPDGRLISCAKLGSKGTKDGTYRLWELDAGDLLGAVPHAEAAKAWPWAWRNWQKARKPQRADGVSAVDGSMAAHVLLNIDSNTNERLTYWHDTGHWVADMVNGEGVVIARAGKEIAILHLYKGSQRVALREVRPKKA